MRVEENGQGLREAPAPAEKLTCCSVIVIPMQCAIPCLTRDRGGNTSGFPLPRIREDRPRFHEDKLRGNDRGECRDLSLPKVWGCLRITGKLRFARATHPGCAEGQSASGGMGARGLKRES